jgi:hypothetical protein
MIRVEWEPSSTLSDLGDGMRVKFWHDIWCADEDLSSLFPELFQIIVNQMLW